MVDNLENGINENLAPVSDRIEIINADLRDSEVSNIATENKDLVINLAAKAYGMEYSRVHNGEMLVDNLLCTLVPLQAAITNGVKRYVIVSSSCVYPDDAPVPTPELGVFTGLPESVNEGYGWAKRIQELAGAYFARGARNKGDNCAAFQSIRCKLPLGVE